MSVKPEINSAFVEEILKDLDVVDSKSLIYIFLTKDSKGLRFHFSKTPDQNALKKIPIKINQKSPDEIHNTFHALIHKIVTKFPGLEEEKVGKYTLLKVVDETQLDNVYSILEQWSIRYRS